MSRRQSYATEAALLCVALTTFMVATVVYDHSRPALLVPALLTAPDPAAVNLAATRQALRTLSKQVAVAQAPVQLPLPVSPMPLPTATAPVVQVNDLFHLSAIVQGDRLNSAVINGRLVHAGDRLDESNVVVEIAPQHVKIRSNGKMLMLVLQAQSDVSAVAQGAEK